jgi:hypothetical protein
MLRQILVKTKVFSTSGLSTGVVSKAGSQNVKIAVMGSDLAENLFSQNQLNVPMAQFFTANGPMSSVVKDASADNYTGWSNGNICDASDTTWTDNPSGGLTAPPPPGGTRTLTTTTLVSPMSGVLGHDMVFTAKVMAGNQPATKGVVYISIDGTVASVRQCPAEQLLKIARVCAKISF